MDDLGLFAKAILTRWWTLMSCAVFTFLGLYSLVFHKSNTWVIAASVAAGLALLVWAAFLVWKDEHNARANEVFALTTEVKKLKDELHRRLQMRPKLTLGVTTKIAKDWAQPDPYLLWIQNTGQQTAAFISIDPINSLSGRYTLCLTGPQTLTAAQHSGLQFEVLEHHHLLTNPAQYPARSYVEMLWEFFKDNPEKLSKHDFKVTIKCRDADGTEVADTMNLRCQYNPISLKVLPS